MAVCLVGLGSNLGDREAVLRRAVGLLAAQPEVRLLACSRWRSTSPVGGPPGQPPFLNGAALLETTLAPAAVLALLLTVETRLGRQREERWGPRTIDLDLLLYDRAIVTSPTLVLPHPRMAWRRFVLEPAAEIAGPMIHPVICWTVARLLEHLDSAVNYVALGGPIGVGKSELAEQCSRRLSCRLIAEELDPARLAAFYADPSGRAWLTEVEFLTQRIRLLAADRAEWAADQQFAISDFWFDQSLAFARIWLPAGQFEEFRVRWEEARRGVVKPKLLVVLDVADEQLLQRIGRRNRAGEDRLSPETLDRIREEILAESRKPDQGPVLRLDNTDLARTLAEIEAAILAMQ